MPVLLAAVTDSHLDVDAHARAVDDARQGACVTFVGTVRNHDPEADGEVVALDYTAHPSAAATLREVAEATGGARPWPRLRGSERRRSFACPRAHASGARCW